MDVAEIKSCGLNLEKAQRDKLPAKHIIDILETLKTKVVASEKVLRETKIGMTVNKLRQFNDKAVAELAKDIVLKWKKDVSGNKPKPAGDSKGGSPMKKETSSNGTSGKPAPSAPAKIVSSANRNRKNDGVNLDFYEDEVRNRSLGLLYDGCCIGSDAAPEHIVKIVRTIEETVYKRAGKRLDDEYRVKMRSLFLNLKDLKNPNLRKRVVSGEIPPERIATMTTEEMASAERKAADQKLEKENMDKAMVPKAEKSTTDQFKCGKCGGRKVSYSQAQTRSADEPMTTFCECEICGNRWKFS